MFTPGSHYSREKVQELLKVPVERRGGAWDTGYTRFNGATYVFCNVGIAGSTGHDYPNRWVDGALEWFGKTNSHLRQPSIRHMLSGEPVHIFSRSQLRAPFTYVGLGRPRATRNTIPVQITWSFSESAGQQASRK